MNTNEDYLSLDKLGQIRSWLSRLTELMVMIAKPRETQLLSWDPSRSKIL